MIFEIALIGIGAFIGYATHDNIDQLRGKKKKKVEIDDKELKGEYDKAYKAKAKELIKKRAEREANEELGND